MRWLASAVCLLFAGASLANENRVVHTAFANLVYQLDCVSEASAACSRDAFAAIWEKQLLVGDDDRRALAEWRAIAQRNDGARAHLRIAGLLASGLADYDERLRLVVAPHDRVALVGIVRHFEARFRAVWPGEAAQPFVRELSSALDGPVVTALLERFRRFYEAELPATETLPFVVIDAPRARSSHGEQIEGVSILERQPMDRVASRLDVALHELCHYFLRVAPQTLRDGLHDRFTALHTIEARGAEALFDEALATALGNGVAGRELDPAAFEGRRVEERGFYDDLEIDAASKAVLPWIDSLLTKRTLSEPSFVEEYVAIVSRSLGARLTAPRVLLRKSAAFVDSALDPSIIDALVESMTVNDVSGTSGDASELTEFLATRSAPTLAFVHPSHARMLARAKLIAANRASSAGPRGYALRVATEPVLVIVAATPADAKRVLRVVARMDAWRDGAIDAEP